MPESLARFCHVEFTMPATYVSHTTLRSLAVTTGDPPEKYVRYLARHEYVVEIEHTSGPGPAAYVAATESENKPPAENLPPPAEEDESDSDSDWKPQPNHTIRQQLFPYFLFNSIITTTATKTIEFPRHAKGISFNIDTVCDEILSYYPCIA